MEIPRQRPNSAARLEIPRPAENCGPYKSAILHTGHAIYGHITRPIIAGGQYRSLFGDQLSASLIHGSRCWQTENKVKATESVGRQ